MNKLIVFAAAAVLASPAFASKARIQALGNSRQLNDTQYVFDRPYLINGIGEQVTMEWGDDAGNTPKAEAGIFTKIGEGMFGLYLGRTGYLSTKTDVAPVADTIPEQNPINLLYGMKSGDFAWGVNLGYSNGKDDAATGDPKTNSMDLVVGTTWGAWEAELGLDLGSKAEATGQEVKVKSNTRLGVGYNIDEMKHAYLTYSTQEIDGGKAETATEIGYINTISKTEDAMFFYGVAYRMTKNDNATTTAIKETSSLPVWFGVEAMATSWMTLRASVKQTVLINESKDANGDKSDEDNIAFATGAGFKMGKGMLDATFGTGQAGHLSFSNGATDEFFSNVSYTYMF